MENYPEAYYSLTQDFLMGKKKRQRLLYKDFLRRQQKLIKKTTGIT